ncbi:MAG: ATP-binding cassette, subfamily bacterial, partial [Frankiaceae bacterium]|nr:ATP-binding cassette, subfamily bacterial [Frankiaceae bacterium]
MGALRERFRALLATAEGGDGLVAAAPPVPVREIFRRFWPYARRYRKWLWVSLIFIVLGPAIDTAMIWMFKIVVDEVLVPRDFDPFWWVALAYVGLTVLAGVVGFLDEYISTWVGQRFLLDLRTQLFAHLQSLPLGFFERRRQGDLLARLTGDIGAIEGLVLSGVADFLSYVFNVIFFTAALFYLQWDLALISLVVAPMFWITAKRFSKLIRTASRERRRRSGSLTAVAEESLGNVQVVQAYNRQSYEVARYEREAAGSFRATMASMRLRAIFTPVVSLIELAGALLVIGLGTYKLSQGELSLGGLLAFMTYLTRLYDPIRALTKLTTTVYSASAGAERVIELLDEQPAVTDRPGARDVGRATGVVRVEGVSYRYPDTDRDAIAGVSFTVGPGETLALVGGSGAGKSTLAKLLLRFHEPATGAILVDGIDIRRVDPEALRARMALVPQDPTVFSGSVMENIRYGRWEATDAEVEEAARLAQIDGFIRMSPHGYETEVGERGLKLSGGEKQRVAIARTILKAPPILLLDEATSALDSHTEREIQDALELVSQDRTTLVIAHRLSTIVSADEIIVLDNGVIFERG